MTARPASLWNAGIVAFVMAGFALACSRTWADPDLWGHLRFGDDLWRTRRIVRADPYSYLTGDQPWVNHEWLSELVFARVFALAGAGGLTALKLGVGLLTGGLLYRWLCRQGLAPLPAGLLFLSVTPLILPGLTTVRPQMFTYLSFVALLLLIAVIEGGARWPALALPPLFTMWANLHGAFLVGLGILGIWAGARALLQWAGGRGRYASPALSPAAGLGVAGTCALATAVNPYGIGLWQSFHGLGDRRLELAEWNPLAIASVVGVTYLLALAVAGAGLALSDRPRNLALVAVLACAALMPHTAVRHAPFFAIAALVVAGGHVGAALRRWPPARYSLDGGIPGGHLARWVPPILLGAAAALLAMSARVSSCIVVDPADYPTRAVAALRASGVAGNVAVFFEWGNYVLWHLGPGVKVSMDPRREMVYSDAVYRENERFTRGTGDWEAVLRRERTDMALVSKSFPMFNLVSLLPGWTLVSEDGIGGLFARRGSPLAERLRRADAALRPGPDGRECFR